MPRVIVHHEILQTGLQHHAVFVELNARGVVDDARHVTMLDLALASHFDGRPAVGSAYDRSAHAGHRRFHGHLGERFRFAHRAQDGVGNRALVGDPALDPALRFCLSKADHAQTRMFQDADRKARIVASGVQADCVNRFPLHFLIPWW